MENKIYNDDVERIVNDPERQQAINDFHEKRQAKRQEKLLVNFWVSAAIAIAFGLFCCVGWMKPWVALLFCVTGGLYSAFCLGRYFENGKCWGWK